MKLPQPVKTFKLSKANELIDQHYIDHNKPFRHHMGLSMCGHECDRYLWLNFRWVIKKTYTGRLLRLFQRGHNEEYEAVRNLRAIGFEIIECLEHQQNLKAGCHVSGSPDGVIVSGVPEAPKTPHLLEIKTHNEKSLKDVKEKGVQDSKPMHYYQMQAYMYLRKLTRAFYYAVCKNTDELHTERVDADYDLARKKIQRLKFIALENNAPPKLTEDKTFFICKMCDYWDFCHKTKLTNNVSCRTCAHSTATKESTWQCEKYNLEIPRENQIKGCEAHIIHPDLLPAELAKEQKHQNSAVFIYKGRDLVNGPEGYKSQEVITDMDACTIDDENIRGVRRTFDAEVVK